jgi:hypothetical protein
MKAWSAVLFLDGFIAALDGFIATLGDRYSTKIHTKGLCSYEDNQLDLIKYLELLVR